MMFILYTVDLICRNFVLLHAHLKQRYHNSSFSIDICATSSDATVHNTIDAQTRLLLIGNVFAVVSEIPSKPAKVFCGSMLA